MPQATWQDSKDTGIGILQWLMAKLKEVPGNVQVTWGSNDIPKWHSLGFLQVMEDDMPKNFHILFFLFFYFFEVCA